MPLVQRYSCISCSDLIHRHSDDPLDLQDAKAVRCDDCAREVLGLPTRQMKDSRSVGYFNYDTGGGTRVIRESKTH